MLSSLQDVVVGSKRAQTQRARAKQLRIERHLVNEAARPQEKRLLTRTDLADHARKFVCRSTMIKYATIIRLFDEFCEDILGHSPGSGASYFEVGGPIANTEMLRKFIFFLADGGQGRGGGRITRRTAVAFVQNLLGALAYRTRRVDREIAEQLMTWTRYSLTAELELRKTPAVSKPIAVRADVSVVIQALYSPLGLRQVLSMRDILNINIFINLLIDSCGRIHEITSTEVYREQYLRWRDLKVYAFNFNGEIKLAAILTVGGLKGMKDQPDQYKEIPLMLLPISLCFEDSLRLLLHAALIDDVIQGASNWTELTFIISRCTSESGVLLLFRESALDLPIMPAINRQTSLVTKAPMGPDFIPRQLRRLGRLLGMRDVCKSHAFRRGAAYTLEAETSADFRTWAMGHTPESRTYAKNYKSKVATSDIQAIMHGSAELGVLGLSSMSLGRVEMAPQRISITGEEKVMMDPAVCEARSKCDAAIDALTRVYPTVVAAEKAGSPLYTAYHTSSNAYKNLVRQMKKREYQAEYDAFCQEHGTLRPMAPSTSVSEPAVEVVGEALSYELEMLQIDSVDTQEKFDDIFKCTEGCLEDIIDPRLLDQDENKDECNDADGSSAAVRLEDETCFTAITVQDRLHGICRAYRKQRLIEGYSNETAVMRPHRWDTLFDDARICATDSDVSALLLPFFKTMHPLERYGVLEPDPSTFICPVCREDCESEVAFESHVVDCARKTASAVNRQMWEGIIRSKMNEKCTWRASKTKLCNKTFTDTDKFLKHILAHSRRKVVPVCKFGDCGNLSNPPQLHSPDDWCNHLAQEHELTYCQSSNSVFYCSFCADWVLLGVSCPADRVAHYAKHEIDAVDSVKRLGYNGISSSANGTDMLTSRHPWFCIFCFHDPTLSVDKRLASFWNEATTHVLKVANIKEQHMLDHFKSSGEGELRCPASAAAGALSPFCSSSGTFTSAELEDHLVQVHKIYIAQGKSAAASKQKKNVLDEVDVIGASSGDGNLSDHINAPTDKTKTKKTKKGEAVLRDKSINII